MSRTPVVIGNWKMELSHKAALELARGLKKLLSKVSVTSEVVVCPSFPSLAAISEACAKTDKLAVGAQTVHGEAKGALTGQVSVTQITPFAEWCLVGHSEVRAVTQETDEEVAHQAQILLKHGVRPVVLVGESQEERQAEQTVPKITQQVEVLLGAMTRASLAKMVIVYEPIWAVGSGEMPESQEAAELILLIRKLVATRFDSETAERLRVLYGGSVTGQSAAAYMQEPGIDGFVVGGASLRPVEFLEIVEKVQQHAR